MSGRSDAQQTVHVERPRGFDDYDLRLGDIMRGERATLGKSLLDVQRDLKIKATYIAAIENADPSVFESPGFIAGYVRSYARYLNMDPEWAFNAFCEEGGFAPAQGLGGGQGQRGKAAKAAKGTRRGGARDPLAEPSVSFIPSEEAPLSGIDARAVGSVAVLAVLIGAIGFGGWSVLREVQKVQFTPVEQTPTVLSQLDPVVPAPAPATAPDAEGTGLPRVEAEGLDRLYRPDALELPVLTARDGPIGTIDPRSVGVLAPGPAAPAPAAVADVAPPAPAATAPVQVLADEPPAVALLAVRPSWVRIRAADGSIIFEKILDAGERFTVPVTEEPPVLRAGNAGALYLAVGEETFGPVGEGASVVRDVVLSAEAVSGTYQVADIERDADLARFVAVAEAERAAD